MRYIYTVLFYLALPFILIRLFWRSYRSKHSPRLLERLGFYNFKSIHQSIWLHAVSYGEAVAAEPLIKLLRAHYPKMDMFISTMTATGASRVTAMWKNDAGIHHVYCPYDIPFAVNRFFKAINPKFAIIMETELWPNILHIAGQNGVPILLANARLSPASFDGYKRIAHFLRPYLKNITKIAAQSKQDADRFLALGVLPSSVVMTGNLKFDIEPPFDQIEKGKALKGTLAREHVIIASSTHPEEEEQVLKVFESLQKLFPTLLLILVPRHPQRFDEVASLCLRRGHVVTRRSQQQIPDDKTTIFLGDSMGELYYYYAQSDIAFVGGSLVPVGGHNLLEPAAVQLPIVTGKYLFNFTAISQWLTESGTLSITHNEEELYSTLTQLLKDEKLREQQGAAGYQVVQQNQGAARTHLEMITQL